MFNGPRYRIDREEGFVSWSETLILILIWIQLIFSDPRIVVSFERDMIIQLSEPFVILGI
jgi:hypothetical protein